LVYFLTMEPTVSFWDCGEFIASAYKLLVGHPPGAPLFAMLGRLFSMFAPEASGAAAMVNLMSVSASALTIGLLFWTITLLVEKIYKYQDKNVNVEWSAERQWKALGAAFIGSMAYTFSDTFWFSAVEAEVYALSSLFTALVFWVILRWDKDVDNETKNADRWILLIAYLMGLSIGVHLLNLLTIPALGLVYFYKRYNKHNAINTWIALGISFVVLGFVQYGIIPGTISVAARFERIATNSMGFSFGTGFFTFLVALAAGLSYGIYYTYKKRKMLSNLMIWAVFLVIAGYSSYGMIAVRSLANTTMDENNPEDVYSMIAYLNREQYGDRPLFYGQYFDAEVVKIQKGKDIYMKAYVVEDANGKTVQSFNMERDAKNFIENAGQANLNIEHRYVVIDKKPEYEFNPRRMTFFPRIWSYQETHKQEYMSWCGLKPNQKPGQSHNIRFFVNYQIYWMYARYFMWNFAGRENDIQGHGEKTQGHWISGITFIDNLVTQSYQDKMPDRLAKNRGRNTYFFLPLILGIFGLLYHRQVHKPGFYVVLTLFLMTGVAIVIYLNQTPLQPRERDYAYAGSFYAFAIWIGLGLIPLYDLLKKYLSNPRMAGAASVGLATLAVPALLAFQNWDDHDRSNRYTARDFAFNYLNTCEQDAILFTNGDNDTFPLWYLQEVEGDRTDVRVVNLSLLNTDWYINQMKRKAYDGLPVPFSLEEPEYRTGQRDQVLMDTKNSNYYTVQEHMAFLRRTDGTNQTPASGSDDRYFYLQSNKFRLPINKEAAARQFNLSAEDAEALPDELRWELNKNYIMKNEVMILDLLASFNWERPIYFAVTVGGSNHFGLDAYFTMEGMAYRLVPYPTNSHDEQTGEVDADRMFTNMMETFRWGNMSDPGVYLDETNLRMMYNFRSLFIRLADKLILKGDKERAGQALDRITELLPDNVVPFDYFNLMIANLYIQIGEYDKADQMLQVVLRRYSEELDYYNRYRSGKGSGFTFGNFAADGHIEREKYRADIIRQQTEQLIMRIQALRGGVDFGSQSVPNEGEEALEAATAAVD
jgi:tetratricopeptide (TPR) repeat protein